MRAFAAHRASPGPPAARHTGDPAPASAKDAAERIGWQSHTVAKRCENIRDRYVRLGVPGLRGRVSSVRPQLAMTIVKAEALCGARSLPRL